jgi:hypothetical protein
MKKSELWDIYVRKYPQFAQEGNITLSSKGLRKFFDTTWDTAYYEGESETEYFQPREDNSLSSLDALKEIFGMR